jgi:hypothetical protein
LIILKLTRNVIRQFSMLLIVTLTETSGHEDIPVFYHRVQRGNRCIPALQDSRNHQSADGAMEEDVHHLRWYYSVTGPNGDVSPVFHADPAVLRYLPGSDRAIPLYDP